jgi:DNA recombination-dependent growth factor C
MHSLRESRSKETNQKIQKGQLMLVLSLQLQNSLIFVLLTDAASFELDAQGVQGYHALNE